MNATDFSPLRIALVTGGLQFGGSTTWALFAARGLKGLGHAVEVFCFTKNHPMHREFQDIGVPVHTADEERAIFEDRLELLYERLRRQEPNVIFAVLGVEPLELFRYAPPGVLRVAMVHDRVPEAFEAIKLHQPHVDHLVLLAKHLIEDARQFVPDLPSTYLAHGVPISPNMPLRQPNPDSSLKILYYGRIDQSAKQVRMFPIIWRGLKERKISFRWTIHGHGPEEGYLREQMAAGVESGEIIFSKPVHYDALDAIIAQHDVYLLASRFEGGPLTLLESMARGLVPVCGDIPCLIQEVVNERNGFRVPHTDPAAYVESLARLDQDRPLLESMSEEARRTIRQDFSVIAMAERYVDFIRRSATLNGPVSWAAKVRFNAMKSLNSPLLYFRAFRPLRRLLKKIGVG